MASRRSRDLPTPIEWLVAELEHTPGCQATKRVLLDLLRRFAGERLYVARRTVIAPHRVATARSMLAGGLTPTEARARLAGRLKCSPDTAERIVTQALRQAGSAAPQPDLFGEGAWAISDDAQEPAHG